MSTTEHLFDPQAVPVFVVNAASGREAADSKRALLEAALAAAGRSAELLFAAPADLPQVSREAAATALSRRAALVAVGGDGTINAVAQAAHARGCTFGVVAQGTFNYFARTHRLPSDPAQAIQMLFQATPMPVQVATVNERVFLVNASVGLYPELLEDREAFKARFGRSRLVAFASAVSTLLREHRQLRLRIDRRAGPRDERTATLFVGNNRLQFEQVGLPEAPNLEQGRIGAVMLKPIGTLSLMRLLLRGALGTLGEAATVESFDFERIVVTPRLNYGSRRVKVAFDGEVEWMRWPLEFKVSPRPLYLLKPT